jgi:hypothetical protein
VVQTTPPLYGRYFRGDVEMVGSALTISCFRLMLDRKLTAKATKVTTRRTDQ